MFPDGVEKDRRQMQQDETDDQPAADGMQCGRALAADVADQARQRSGAENLIIGE